MRAIFHSLEERQRTLAAFGQQVSPEIAAALLEQGGRIESRRSFVCVMFMDIRGFTRLVQGSEARKQYSVTGEVVILASRIEQLNKEYGSQLLASAEALRDAGEALPASASLGPVKVKGRDDSIEIFRLA